jgi:ABC-type transport system involved in Fe-S cluster assembly fused permease/ATPase subunit
MNNEKLEKERYSYYLNKKLEGTIKMTKTLSLLNFGQQVIFNAGLGINLLLAVAQVKAGTMTIGDIFLIQSLFINLYGPLNLMGTIYREMIESQVEINDLLGILDIKSRVVESQDAKDYQYLGGRLQIEQLDYSVGKNVFQGLDLHIEPGSTNAFVGESGCGKSSLFRLIYRLVDPSSGRILLDGQDLKSLKLDSFRKLFTIVPQTPVLFNDTILYNVRYGNPSASLEEVQNACKAANIHSRILEFPEGYESLVGELGSKLSGGERQRLILARGLLRESKFILLDEFTSAMDSHNEQEILTTLKRLIKDKTVIFNSHRLSTTMFVDKIFIIDGGKICESGTHEELLRNEKSKYFELWNKFIKKQN